MSGLAKAGTRGGATGPVLALAVLLAGCGALDRAPDSAGLELSFEDQPEPAVFEQEGPAERAGESSADGLWAVVGGLSRPERARVVNLATGDEVDVALFRGGGGILLSREAADALGIADRPVRVRVVALRREASIVAPRRWPEPDAPAEE